ncbi:MAG: TIGR02147 family protein [Myxococcota bacterium]
MNDPERPDVYAYTAFRQFLADWFAWKKSGKAPFSHRIFAKRLGSSDPSVLSNVIKGHRRLAETRISLFAKAMDLDPQEAEYFTLLVRLGQAGPGEEHERAWAALTQYRVERQGPSIDADQVKVISNLYFTAIRALAECEGFRPDPAWIGQHLRPAMAQEQVSEALTILERLGWLVRDGEKLMPATPRLQSAERVAA